MNKKDKLFRKKRVLITGAAGTIGRELIDQLLRTELLELCALDNNESEIFLLEQQYQKDARFHSYVGDVRDADKMNRLMSGIDIVFHGAALKHVILCEHSPFDAVQTNIIGVKNIINAALMNKVERVISMSSDKAVNPTNVMGTSKLMGERLMTAANSLKRSEKTIFTSTRFGNVLGSNGSVLHVFYKQIKSGGQLTLTSPEMTRFVMTSHQAVGLVLETAMLARGGEVFVTKMPIMRIQDLAEAMIDVVAPTFGYNPDKIKIEIIGVKPGEKMYEELMNEEEIRRALELPELFVILPAFRAVYADMDYNFPGVKQVKMTMAYRSDHEKSMSKDEIKSYLMKNQILKMLGE
jgi:FlaA1/EpsC-like NDP-sugar epimerase